MPKALLLTGAYGRTAALADWHTGKDFKIVGGPYCSVRDVKLMKQDGFDTILLVAPGAQSISIDINAEIVANDICTHPSLV